MNWLSVKFCPNYLIPCINMIDHLTDIDLFAEDIDALYQLLPSKELSVFADVTHDSRIVEEFEAICASSCLSVLILPLL